MFLRDELMRKINRRKNIISVFLLLLLLFCLAVPAFAEQGEAIGNFSGGTGESSRIEGETEGEDGEKLISLSNGVKYGTETGLFYQTVENSTFGVSVPSGAIVTGTVSASLPAALTGVLYKNGTEVENADLSKISAAGKYILAVTANDATQTIRVNFTIVSSPTGSIKEYKMPDDFYVVSATCDGEPVSHSQTYVDMSAEGEYVISYRSPEADKDFELRVTVDHTAPEAVLTGITDGKANGPVTVSIDEEDVKTYLVKNGKQVTFTGTIEDTGSYTLTLQDEAGNESVYDFIIISYMNSNSKVLVGALIVLLLALAGYIIYYRKYIRVS